MRHVPFFLLGFLHRGTYLDEGAVIRLHNLSEVEDDG